MTGAVEGALRDALSWISGVASELGHLSWAVPAGVVAAGAFVLVAGARWRRPVAVLGAAGVAALAALTIGPGVLPGWDLPVGRLALVGAAVAGALAAVVPQVFPVLAGALPGALVAELFAPEGMRLEVVAVGALLGALVGLFAARPVAALVASAVGALAVALGAAGLLGSTGASRILLRHPTAILALVVVLSVAGAAFQLSRAWGRGAEGAAGKGGGKAPPPLKDWAEKG